MPIIATFELIFLVAKVDVVGPNPIARSNNKRRLPKGSLFFVIRSGGMRSHEKVGPTRTRGGRKYAGEAESRARTQRQRQSLCPLQFIWWNQTLIKIIFREEFASSFFCAKSFYTLTILLFQRLKAYKHNDTNLCFAHFFTHFCVKIRNFFYTTFIWRQFVVHIWPPLRIKKGS